MSAQTADTIVIFGNNYWMIGSPLREYLEKKKYRLNFWYVNEGNHRGFEARWLIEDNQLFLTEFTGPGLLEKKVLPGEDLQTLFRKVNLASLFPEAKGKVLADWYTGFISVPYGPVIDDNHFLLGTILEFTATIILEKGVVVDYGGLTKEKIAFG